MKRQHLHFSCWWCDPCHHHHFGEALGLVLPAAAEVFQTTVSQFEHANGLFYYTLCDIMAQCPGWLSVSKSTSPRVIPGIPKSTLVSHGGWNVVETEEGAAGIRVQWQLLVAWVMCCVWSQPGFSSTKWNPFWLQSSIQSTTKQMALYTLGKPVALAKLLVLAREN